MEYAVINNKDGDIMSKTETEITCKSVFKSGESTITRVQFTKAWIELINQLEKNKRATIGKR